MTSQPKQIRDMKLVEVSLVDIPANPGARMVMMKRHHDDDEPGAGHPRDNRNGGPMSDDIQKRLDASQAQVGALTKSVSGLTAALEAAGHQVTVAEDGGVTTKSLPEEDFIEVGGERMLKSALPKGVLTALTAQGKALDVVTDKLAKAEMTKRAETELGNIAGDDDAKIELLKAVDGIADDDKRKAVQAVLKGADTLAGKLTTEVGHKNGGSAGDGSDPDASAKLDKMADDLAAERRITKAAAYREVLKTPDGAKLLAASGGSVN